MRTGELLHSTKGEQRTKAKKKKKIVQKAHWISCSKWLSRLTSSCCSAMRFCYRLQVGYWSFPCGGPFWGPATEQNCKRCFRVFYLNGKPAHSAVGRKNFFNNTKPIPCSIEQVSHVGFALSLYCSDFWVFLGMAKRAGPGPGWCLWWSSRSRPGFLTDEYVFHWYECVISSTNYNAFSLKHGLRYFASTTGGSNIMIYRYRPSGHVTHVIAKKKSKSAILQVHRLHPTV